LQAFFGRCERDLPWTGISAQTLRRNSLCELRVSLQHAYRNWIRTQESDIALSPAVADLVLVGQTRRLNATIKRETITPLSLLVLRYTLTKRRQKCTRTSSRQ
jgi:hypothetical protein